MRPPYFASKYPFSRTVRAAIAGMALAATAPAWAAPTGFQPSAAQPVLPGGDTKPTSPVVESLVPAKPPVLEVRRAARHETTRRHRRVARYRPAPPAIERPALAGVELLQPLPHPGQPAHVVVPTPGYPLDSFITAFTMPAPPIVCRPTPRDPNLPDPHLYRERTVRCEADNP